MQNNANLQAKYESIALWAKMISEVNSQLKDEFVRSQTSVRMNVETIIDIIK
jgi:hypothetical protein